MSDDTSGKMAVGLATFQADTLAANVAYYQSVIDHSDDAIITKTLTGVILTWNQGAEKIFGYTAHEMIGANMLALYPSDRVAEENEILKKIADGKTVSHFRSIRQHKNGEPLYISASFSPIRSGDGQLLGISSISRDVTIEWALTNRLRLISQIYLRSQQAVVIVNEQGKISEVNAAFNQIMGYRPEEVIGQSPLTLHAGKQNRKILIQIEKDLRSTGYFQGEVWTRKKDGTTLASFLSICRVQLSGATYFAGIFTDITALKVTENQLVKMMHYDALTNLPNRLLFTERLNQEIIHCDRSSLGTVILYIDLDDFSNINQVYGQEIGDQLITSVAATLSASVRDIDCVARLESDNFIGFLSTGSSGSLCSEIIDRILQNISIPVQLGERSIQVTASIGVRFYTSDQPKNSEMLIRQAHQAMIEAKQSGKGRYKIFNPDRDRAIKMRLGALEDIVSGLVREEFHVEYQPKVNLKTGKLIGLEALARWQHPTRGLLQPLEFLPALTESSAKTAFTEHLIKMVFAQSVLWAKEGFRPLVSLNVYINQLHDSFYQFIGQELARVPEVKPCNIEFELLETDELLNINYTVTVIESLREMGFTFSVDDFGSGYSSLTYLRKIPFDTIKIDQDFVLNDGLSEKNADIVRAIIELARIFKRQVIAEGIETIEAGTTLIEMGCPNGQGFAIAKPMPASEVFDWCRTWKAPQAWLNASPG